jgi:hypothetical protein
MRIARSAVVASIFTALLCLLLPASVLAQVTTSTLRGAVKGADDNQAMGEVEVTLVNEATGDTRTTTTNSDGVFVFTNLQVGGPYHVTANFSGFKPAEEKALFLQANRTRDIAMSLRLTEEVIEVESNALARSTSNRTVVTAAEIDELPSVNRDPRDVVRRNPEVTVEGGARALSIGGANNRYNSITIDGVREDDDFGLNASGYPTRRSPIALSAVQELAVESAPFDVRFGKFLGGNVNVVTKSGTNEFKGTVFGTYSSDSLLGSQSGTRRINVDYTDYRYGATVGGPIIKDKLFFLASVEGLTSTTPIDNGPKGSGASTEVAGVTSDEVQRAKDIARTVYGFDAGDPSKSVSEHDLKVLGKLDYIISPEHRATVIYQRTGGNSVQVGNAATPTSLPLSSNWYDAQDTLNTFTGRFFSDWTDKLSTEVEFNAKLVQSRVPSLNGNDFMAASITTSTPGTIIRLGPDNSRHANQLDNNVIHGKAEANYVLGENLLTGGFEYERTYIDNLFIQNALGTASYNSLDDFMNMKPSQIVYTNSVTLNPADAAANWNFGVATGYLQDQLKLTPDLTLQGGVRVEAYQTSSHPALNQKFVARYLGTPFNARGNGENNSTLNGRSIWMPRLGLSWLPLRNLNLRGGAGLYSGGTPGVWQSNNYTNDGIRTFSVTQRDATVINGFDGRNIPQAIKTAVMNGMGNGNVDVLDPDFRIPSVWKVGGGFDYSLDIPEAGDYGKGLELRANYTYTKVRNGVNWIDLRRNLAILPNNTPVGVTPDGRPLYPATFPTRGVDMMLTNDPRGFGELASVVVQKGFPFGLFVSASYAYTNTQEVSPGTSSVSTSNYGIVAVTDPNRPDLAISNYTRKHRFTGALEYSHSVIGYFTDARMWKDMKTSFGVFMESRSGQPYSWTFSGVQETGANTGRTDTTGQTLSRIFGEDSSIASRNRELFYVPNDAQVCEETFAPGCTVTLKGINKTDFNNFLDRTGLAKYRGKIAPRNAFNGPRYNRIDLRFAQDIPNPMVGQRARIVLDIENFGNLLNSDWGLFRQVAFPYYTPAVDVGYDRANNSYTYYNLRSPNPTSGPGNADVLLSVWRVGVGIMYDF